MKTLENHKKITSLILVIFFSLTLIIAGLDKFFNILSDWIIYLNPKFLLFSIDPSLFMKFVGTFEVLLGLSLFTRWRKTASYIVAIWFIFISFNLISIHLYFIAFKDFLRAIGAILLAKFGQNNRQN